MTKRWDHLENKVTKNFWISTHCKPLSGGYTMLMFQKILWVHFRLSHKIFWSTAMDGHI